MVEIKKDKNLVYISDDGKTYIVNINSGIIINDKTKREVSRLPFAKKNYIENNYYTNSRIKDFPYSNLFELYIRQALSYSSIEKEIELFPYIDRYLSLIENLIKEKNIDISTYYIGIFGYLCKEFSKTNTPELFEYLFKNIKITIQIIKEYFQANCFSKICNISSIVTCIKRKKDPFYLKVINTSCLNEYQQDSFIDYFKNENEIMQDLAYYYFITQKWYIIMTTSDFKSYLKEYIDCCNCIGKIPIKTSNGMREFIETRQTYLLQKKEYDKIKWTNIYKAREKELLFEYGNYEVVLPKEPQDLVTEGQLMHHCVGGYVEQVLQKNTLIVFIRNKANLETPYITCEVKPQNGIIGQYFLAYDKYISSKEDIEFKTMYQRHLSESWVK